MATAMAFSIIVPYYDASVSDDELTRCLASLAAQTFRNFEVLLFHDGPPSRPLPAPPANIPSYLPRCTSARANDFGHSLRDAGIRLARGDYIVHLNSDNFLYPFALEELARSVAMDEPETVGHVYRTNPALLVFPIVMHGVVGNGHNGIVRTRNPNHRIVLNGCPPLLGTIDCMQLVMKRALWLAYGGWYDKTANSDSVMYSRFIQENGARMVGRVLGEHW